MNMLNYLEIDNYANSVRNNTGIRDVVSYDLFLENLGAQINLLSVDDWESKKYPFVAVSKEGFNLFICSCFPEDLRRVFYLKAFGHYLLHFQMGKRFGKVSDKIKEQKNKEALYFALSIIIPNNEIIELIKEGFDREKLSKLFRVPIQMIDFKISVLKECKVLLF